MSDNNQDNLILEVLLEVRAAVAPDLDETLLRNCFEIQRRHQFSLKRDQPSAAMERLIDEIVDAMAVGREE